MSSRKPLHEALAAAKLVGGEGGSGGTSDYTQLANKPSINGTILIGNKTLSNLGIEWVWRGTRAEYEAAAATIPPNTFVDITDEPDIDNFPTQGSLNPVTSNGLYTELSKLKVINENPENHNGIYRGKDLTNVYTIEQIYERVHDGSFEDLYLGDYFTVHLTTDLMTRFTGSAFVTGTTYYEMDSGTDVTQRTWMVTQDENPQEGKVYATKEVIEEDVDYMIAGFDLYLKFGEAGDGMTVTDHHAIMIPKKYYKTVEHMHSSYELTGYAGSDMHNITLPCYAASTKTALNNHVMRRRTSLNGTVDPNVPSMAGGGYMGGTAVSSKQWTYMQLLNEVMWTGTTVQSSSWREVGLDHEKLPIFNYMNLQELFGQDTASIWLRNVSLVQNGGVYYIVAGGYGIVSAVNAIALHYVMPFFLFG